jgi:hypothetical protein
MPKPILLCAGFALLTAGCGAGRNETARRADLVVSAFRVPSLAPGHEATVSLLVRNVGTSSAARSALTLDLWRDGQRVRLTTPMTTGLAAGRGARLSVGFTVPGSARPGRYRLQACADALRRVHEHHEGNNCGRSRLFVLRAAATPTPTPTPSPPPPIPEPTGPPPSPTAAIRAHWLALGDAQPGDSIPVVEAALGVAFGAPNQLTETCSYANTADGAFGIIVAHNGAYVDGTVQAFIVRTPNVRMVDTEVGVGSSLAEVREAYPKWAASGGVNSTGGENVWIGPSPYAQRPDVTSTGRGALFEADPDGTVVQYRVGAYPYVTHLEYCSSPE